MNWLLENIKVAVSNGVIKYIIIERNICTECWGLVDETGYRQQLALDNLPYLTLYYANGPGNPNRTNLTGVDTGQYTQFCVECISEAAI